MHVYPSSDPYWCMPEDLANFGVLRQGLQLVQSVAPSEFDQCQSLSSFVKAVPKFASLLDKECPTILVLAALKRQGWRQDPSLRPLTHCSDNQHVRLCDSRGGPSIKFYLQCLLDLPKSLGLTSRMPSNCRQSYYRCILLGRHVEASMTDRECRAALLGLPVEAVAPMAPIEDGEVFELAAIGDSEDIPAPIADGGDGIVLGGGVVAPLPKAKAKGKKKPVEKGFLPLPAAYVEPVVDPVVALVAPVLPPAPLVPPPLLPPLLPPGSAPGSSTDVVLPIGPPPLPPPAEGPLENLEDVVVPAAVVVAPAAGPKRKRNWRACVAGPGEIFMDVYSPVVGPGYQNWIIRFFHDKQWEKKRTINDQSTLLHGMIEPIAFLHAFRDLIIDGSLTNVRGKPEPPQVAALVDLHRAEYVDIWQSYQ